MLNVHFVGCINWEEDFFVHHRIISAVERVEIVGDGMSKMSETFTGASVTFRRVTSLELT